MLEQHAIAIPHCEAIHAKSSAIYLLRPTNKVHFQQADDDNDVAVSLVIALIVENPQQQLKLLRCLFGKLQQPDIVETLITLPETQFMAPPLSPGSRVLIALIRVYQRLISPLLGPHCRFTPTCSSYGIEALRRFGVIKGTGWVMAAAMEQHYVASLSFIQAVNQCIEVKSVIFRIIISVFTNFQTCRVKDALMVRPAWVAHQTQRPGGADKQPYSRNNSYPDVLGALHLNQHNGAQYQRYGCQHLVGNTEQRPQALNAAQRIDHALIQQVISTQLNAFPGCEVAVSDAPSGQLIVVVEAEDSETLIQTIESVRNVEGVLAVSLVYHQQEEQGEETP